MGLIKTREEKELNNMLVSILVQLEKIYSNKSSDEYKMAGDITKSKMYSGIENMIANLSQLKGFNKRDAVELKQMFNALHRPVYKQLVKEYITQPNERNSAFTSLFTAGYRVLVAELSRIFASTIATEKGLVYKPEKISQSIYAARFIKAFNKNMEKQMDECIRKSHTETPLQVQTEYFIYQESIGRLGVAIAGLGIVKSLSKFIEDHEIIDWLKSMTGIFDFIFGARKEINPGSYINYVLTNQYQKNVDAFYHAQKMYEETQKAYEEYMKLPANDRKAKVESNYVKNIKKYNIQMENLRAKIAHYDSRAKEEARENVKKITKSGSNKPDNGNDINW